MLQSTSKGKDLVEKQLVILGGTPQQQKDFLEQLNPEQESRSRYRRPKPAPISNKYALGYTYHDVLDADNEGVLARLNVYMLSKPAGSFSSLLKPLLNAKTVKHTLVTILLDWSDPRNWARQLRQWIRLLRKVILSLDEDTKIEMEETMSGKTTQQGEGDEELGIPLNVVCIESEKIEQLEREQGWQEDHFDFLSQWIRTVLLKHGASLCHVASFDSNDVKTLVHSSLGIQSLLKKDVAKHNVIDRDKILVPPKWDSWGKIRIIRDAFDAETVSERWTIEIQQPPETNLSFDKEKDTAVSMFESSIPAPPQKEAAKVPEIDVTVPSLQEFLTVQKEELDRLALKDEAVTKSSEVKQRNRVVEHIGTYNINVNGIDVDAEEATRRLREREQERSTRRDVTPGKKDDKLSTEQYKDFFAQLAAKKGMRGSNPASGVASPRRESPTPERRITDRS